MDRTGRRRRLLVAAGSAGGSLLVLAVLALVAGFTGVGPATVPGWPASDSGNELQVGKPEPTKSSAAPTGTPLPRPTRTAQDSAGQGAATAATTPPPGAVNGTSPTASPANTHRRVPTQTPHARKSKDR